jgi:hypothetical protein
LPSVDHMLDQDQCHVASDVRDAAQNFRKFPGLTSIYITRAVTGRLIARNTIGGFNHNCNKDRTSTGARNNPHPVLIAVNTLHSFRTLFAATIAPVLVTKTSIDELLCFMALTSQRCIPPTEMALRRVDRFEGNCHYPSLLAY